MVEFNVEEIASLEEGMKRLEELAKSGLGMDDLSKLIQSLASKLGLGKEAVAGMTGTISSLVAEGKKAFDALTAMNDVGNLLQPMLKEGGKAIEGFKNAVGDAGMSTGGFIAKVALINPISMRLQDIPKHFTAIGDSVKDSQAQISNLLSDTKVFSAFSSAISAANGGTIFKKEDIEQYAKMIDASRNLQKSMIQTAAATGNLSEFTSRAGANFENLDSMVGGYNEKITRIAKSTGRVPEEVAKLDKSLSLIPGSLNNINQTTTIAGVQMNMLEAAIRFADGSGQEATTVFEDLAFAAENIGLQGEDALHFLDRMKQASDATNLPMKDLREAIKASASEFAMLGDNTDAAINLMGRLAPALKEVGVAPANVNKIFKDLTSSIHGMGVAQRSFLSSQTGGAGGLQGAFQIEQMLADGKSDEVATKMMENFQKHIGNRTIVTRKEAAEKGGAEAAQYQKQVMLMMSPAMGGLAKDTDSAAKLIDAMSKGDMSVLAKGLKGSDDKSKDESLTSTMNTGVKIQDKLNTTLNELNITLQGISGNAAAALGHAQPVVEDKIRDTLNYSSRQEVRDQSAEMRRANSLTGTGYASSIDPNELYERLGNGKEVQDAVSDGDLKRAAKAIWDAATDELGFTKQTRVSYDQKISLDDSQTKVSSAIADDRKEKAPDNKTARIIQDAQGFNTAKNAKESTARSVAGPGPITVQTICSDCQKVIARDAANQAIKHNHNSESRQAHLGAG